MSNEEAIANLVRLMTSFNLEIKALPDDLKCAKCKSVLKNACQMPCGCRFCRTCIDVVISKGDKFCPGGSQECGSTPLSTAMLDYRANKNILKLTAKCPHTGCLCECPLTDIESHMHACSSKNINCPFRELGCAQGALPGQEMSGHLLLESQSHSEILVVTFANFSRDMEMLKRELLLKDEQVRHLENEMKVIKNENKSIRDENKAINDVNKSIKIDINSVKDEMKSIKEENESIKREKEVLCDRVRRLSKKLEREIDERHHSDERDSAMVTAVTGAVASNLDEIEPVISDIRSISDQFDCTKCRLESIQVAGLEQLDDWLIEENVAKTGWSYGFWNSPNASRNSSKFGRTFTCQLSSYNSVSDGEFGIYLIIFAGPSTSQLQWPSRFEVTVTVAHRDRREMFSRRERRLRIARPLDNECRYSEPLRFRHAALRVADVDLERGVRVSCRIVPGAGQ